MMSLCERARFNFMHFMPYIYLPGDQEEYASLWVDFPNRLYDPKKGTRICPFGSLITIQYPNRLAEEYAMLDVLSGGRLEVAFPFGTGMEYWSNANQVNPATARGRFRESIDIVRRAWTQPGPFAYDGEFYTYKYLNV